MGSPRAESTESDPDGEHRGVEVVGEARAEGLRTGSRSTHATYRALQAGDIGRTSDCGLAPKDGCRRVETERAGPT